MDVKSFNCNVYLYMQTSTAVQRPISLKSKIFSRTLIAAILAISLQSTANACDGDEIDNDPHSGSASCWGAEDEDGNYIVSISGDTLSKALAQTSKNGFSGISTTIALLNEFDRRLVDGHRGSFIALSLPNDNGNCHYDIAGGDRFEILPRDQCTFLKGNIVALISEMADSYREAALSNPNQIVSHFSERFLATNYVVLDESPIYQRVAMKVASGNTYVSLDKAENFLTSKDLISEFSGRVISFELRENLQPEVTFSESLSPEDLERLSNGWMVYQAELISRLPESNLKPELFKMALSEEKEYYRAMTASEPTVATDASDDPLAALTATVHALSVLGLKLDEIDLLLDAQTYYD